MLHYFALAGSSYNGTSEFLSIQKKMGYSMKTLIDSPVLSKALSGYGATYSENQTSMGTFSGLVTRALSFFSIFYLGAAYVRGHS